MGRCHSHLEASKPPVRPSSPSHRLHWRVSPLTLSIPATGPFSYFALRQPGAFADRVFNSLVQRNLAPLTLQSFRVAHPPARRAIDFFSISHGRYTLYRLFRYEVFFWLPPSLSSFAFSLLLFLTMSPTADSSQTPLTSVEAAALSSSQPKATTAATASPATQDASGGQPAATPAAAAELASTKIKLLGALRSFPDFPIPGINFIDILPLFQDVTTHLALLRALELQVLESAVKPDVIVGLDARGFLFGPSLALRLNASFVPVRKKGKMPGPCVTAAYEKEYGTDFFQMQEGAIKPDQKVLVVDDIIATGERIPFFASLSLTLAGNPGHRLPPGHHRCRIARSSPVQGYGMPANQPLPLIAHVFADRLISPNAFIIRIAFTHPAKLLEI